MLEIHSLFRTYYLFRIYTSRSGSSRLYISRYSPSCTVPCTWSRHSSLSVFPPFSRHLSLPESSPDMWAGFNRLPTTFTAATHHPHACAPPLPRGMWAGLSCLQMKNSVEERGLCYGVKRGKESRSGTSQNPQTPTPNLTPTKNNKSHVL